MLAALLATMVSLPEPVLTFSMPQIVSFPVWLLEALPLAAGTGSQVDGDVDRGGREIERVAARPAVAVVTEVDVVAVADLGHDQVVAGAAEDGVVARPGRDQVVAAFAEQPVRTGVAVDDIGLLAAERLVVAGTGEDHVAAGTAADQIRAFPGRDHVRSGIADRHVVAAQPDDRVVAGRPHQHVRAGGPELHLTARRRRRIAVVRLLDRRLLDRRLLVGAVDQELRRHDTREGDRMGPVRDGLRAVGVLGQVVSRRDRLPP